MIAMKALDVEAQKVETAPYKGPGSQGRGRHHPVAVQGGGQGWDRVRACGTSPSSRAARFPIHNHFYHQTMYILTGEFECRGYDVETDKMVEKRICGGGDMVYSPSMEPHGMKNVGSTPGSFLCCIANVYDDEKQ